MRVRRTLSARHRAARATFYTTHRRTFNAALVGAWVAGAVAASEVAGAPPTPPLSPDPLPYVSPSRTYETVHTALDLDIDMDNERIAGSVTHRLRALRDGLATIHLNCVELTVDSVSVDGRAAGFDYPVPALQSTSWLAGAETGEAGDQLVIRCEPALRRSAEVTVTIHYRGAPKIGLYWIRPEKGISSKRREVWSQGEGEDNRYWIPCHDYPNDTATFEGRFRVPKGYTAISNGALVSQRDLGAQTEFIWKHDFPQVSYLIMLAVAKYRIYEDTWRGIPVQYVVPPAVDDETILREYALTPDMMEFFSTLIGIDYPYAKYATVVVQDYIYGGMENTTATVMNMRTLHDESSFLTRSEQNLVAHELAHQWWGDMVTCREWSHMWLNEGFATYYAYLYKEHREGDASFRYQVRHAQNDVVAGDNSDPRPMVVDFFNRTDARNNAHVYVKGASVLHMLRFLLGDDLYHEVIRTYGTRHRFDVVETTDLMRVVKDVTGENLDWFFEQWVYLAGHPKFKVTKRYDRELRVLHLKVEQTQKTAGLVPVFRTPVDIEITWEGGSLLQRVVIEDASESFYFAVPSEPTRVVFDKGDWILKTLDFPKPTAELLTDLAGDDFPTRVRAAEALAAKGSDAPVVPALREVVMGDAHWGLRREAALALGRIGSEEALTALVACLAADDARARLAVAEALGLYYGNERAAKALEPVVTRDRAVGVRAQAVASLVKMRAARASAVCVEALKQESDRSIVRAAALGGLAELKDPRMLDRVKPWATPGNEREHRHPALAAYAVLAKELESENDRRRAAEFLYPMLDDWHLRTRKAVIDAIGALGDPSSVTRLRQVAASDPLASIREFAARTADRVAAEAAARSAPVQTAAELEDLRRRIDALEKEIEEARRRMASPKDAEVAPR